MQLIDKYFTNITSKQRDQFIEMRSLYEYWNNKINLISRKNIQNLYTQHILHSLSIAKVIKFKEKTNILDVGTGGGFPGIPLAILFPKTKFQLLDSITKKIKVVDNIYRSLDLKNVRTINKRAENINMKYDFIIGRAVTSIISFQQLTKDKINTNSFNNIDNGIIYLTGGDLNNELRNIKHKKYNISDFFQEEFFRTKKIIYIKQSISSHRNK